jgi:hypothetical protein
MQAFGKRPRKSALANGFRPAWQGLLAGPGRLVVLDAAIAANQESRADNVWIPGSRSARPGMTPSGGHCFGVE